jgi:hypothetical protein
MLIRHSVAPLMDSKPPPALSYLFGDKPAARIPPVCFHPVVYANQIQGYGFQIDNVLYKHEYQITSDLIHIPTPDRDQKLAFGDQKGNLCIRQWSQNVRPIVYQMANAPITDLEYIENSGLPLIFAVSQDGACHCARFADKGPSSTKFLSFDLYEELTPSTVRCTIAKGPMVLYSYIPEVSVEFVRRDLRGDRLLRPLRPRFGEPRGIHVHERDSGCIALISSQFELWDLRTSLDAPAMTAELVEAPFILRALDGDRYAIATKKPMACELDLRAPASPQYRPVNPHYDTPGVVVHAFDAHPGAMTALAHSKGLTVMNLTGAQRTITSIRRLPSTVMLNVNALLFHESEMTLAFVHDHDRLGFSKITEERRRTGCPGVFQ